MKVSELTGPLLREWVARANGWKVERDGDDAEATFICWDDKGEPFSFGEFGYCPDKNWAQGGLIIDREQITIRAELYGAVLVYFARAGLIRSRRKEYRGETHLIASMRAFVASKYGDTVPDDPEK